MEAMCLKVMENQQSKFQSEIKLCIAQEMEQVESRLLARLQAEFAPAHAAYVQRQEELCEQIESVREEAIEQVDHMADVLDTKLDDEYYNLRTELEEYVRDEVAHAEAKVVEHMENHAVVSLSFS